MTGLDRQGSSGSGGAEIEQPYSLSQSDTGSSRSTMSGAIPNQNRRKSPSATQDEEGGAIASELACPCCAVPWRELNLELRGDALDRTAEEEQRAAHVEACLFVAQQESVDSGLASSRSASVALAGKDEDGSSFALHGTAEDEGSEVKGRQIAAHGRSAKDEGAGGDAAHETSVNSTPGE